MHRAYLTRPKRHEGAEGEPGLHSRCPHLGESSAHWDGEGTGNTRLDLDLSHLPRAKSNIGEQLGGCGASQPDEAFVLVAGLFTGKAHVGIFENFIETVLEGTLEGVANQSRSETFPSSCGTLLGDDGSETRDKTLVFGWVHLKRANDVRLEHKRVSA